MQISLQFGGQKLRPSVTPWAFLGCRWVGAAAEWQGGTWEKLLGWGWGRPAGVGNPGHQLAGGFRQWARGLVRTLFPPHPALCLHPGQLPWAPSPVWAKGTEEPGLGVELMEDAGEVYLGWPRVEEGRTVQVSIFSRGLLDADFELGDLHRSFRLLLPKSLW